MFLFQTTEGLGKSTLACITTYWSFDKYLLVLHKLVHGEAMKDVKFDKSPF